MTRTLPTFTPGPSSTSHGHDALGFAIVGGAVVLILALLALRGWLLRRRR